MSTTGAQLSASPPPVPPWTAPIAEGPGPEPAERLPERVRRILVDVVASPAARLFAAVWLASVLALTAAGPGFPLF